VIRRLMAFVIVLGLLELGARLQAEPCIESIALTPAAARIQQPLNRYEYGVRVRVRQHPEHRLLVLEWDGGESGAGSSRRDLEGRDAAITWTFHVRDQLAGHYHYVATVYDDRGKPVGRAELETVLVGEDTGGSSER
jgi:hypothetical protein